MDMNGRVITLRAAGGHIHFGGKIKSEEAAEPIVRTLDAILGVCCVSLFDGLDDPRRRQTYGMAGEYRLPKHGLEYRVLSNAWLCHPVVMHLIFDFARAVYMLGKQGCGHHWKTTEAKTVKIINNCDVKGARKQITENRDLLEKLLRTRYYDASMYKKTADMIFNGVKSFVKDPDDIAGNWQLDGGWISHSGSPNKHVANAIGTIKKDLQI
jgi:hypothetical protein